MVIWESPVPGLIHLLPFPHLHCCIWLWLERNIKPCFMPPCLHDANRECALRPRSYLYFPLPLSWSTAVSCLVFLQTSTTLSHPHSYQKTLLPVSLQMRSKQKRSFMCPPSARLKLRLVLCLSSYSYASTHSLLVLLLPLLSLLSFICFVSPHLPEL